MNQQMIVTHKFMLVKFINSIQPSSDVEKIHWAMGKYNDENFDLIFY
jgi:hypothetical protein